MELNLEDLHVSITSRGAKHIASHLKLSPVISELILSDGSIQDGLLHIAEALQTNSSLTRLSLVNVELEITEQIDFALTKMLQVNKSVTYLKSSVQVVVLPMRKVGVLYYNYVTL